MDAKFFSSIKKHKKSNAIGFESVPLNIKIVFFWNQKRAYFFRISLYIDLYLEILIFFYLFSISWLPLTFYL